MGMYDTISARCPECGGVMETQTKDGPCLLNYYEFDNFMDVEAAAISDGAVLNCEFCNKLYQIRVENITVPVRLVRLSSYE